jgi:hypothetical protein
VVPCGCARVCYVDAKYLEKVLLVDGRQMSVRHVYFDMLMQTLGHLCMYWVHVRLLIYIIVCIRFTLDCYIYMVLCKYIRYILNCIENAILSFSCGL